MMKYSEPVSLHNSDDVQSSEVVEVENISLPQLWEYVIRSKSLPDGLDLDSFLLLISERLRNPEWEVRQHALRVLVDFIPLIEKTVLDTKLQTILDDVVANLGHVGPAVRKGTVDALKTYINNSNKPDKVLRDLLEKVVTKPHDTKFNSVTLGAIIALPFLLTKKISKDVVAHVVNTFLDKLNRSSYQETTLRALLRIKGIVGAENFLEIINAHKSRREFETLCDLYNIPEPNPNDLIGDVYNDEKHFQNDYNLNVVSSFESDNLDDGNEELGKMIEDRVILETEFKLDSGPAITMQIHEESGENSFQNGSDSDEETRGIRTFKVLPDDSEDDYELLRRTPRKVRFGGAIVKMRTPDSDSNHPSDEDHIFTSTAPQRPKTNEIQNDAKRRKSKSHIPVRIPNRTTRSEPNSPKKVDTSKQYRSSPNLTKTQDFGDERKSRIPRRYEKKENRYEHSVKIKLDDVGKDRKEIRTSLKVSKNSTHKQSDDDATSIKSSQNSDENKSNVVQEELPVQKLPTIEHVNDDKQKSKTQAGKTRRNSDIGQYSPIPVHNEIEVFHNLTRSPERNRRKHENENDANRHLTDDVLLSGEKSPTNERKIRTADFGEKNSYGNQFVFVNNYNSFHVYNAGSGRFDFSDSPIPTRDTGECLTCSSSGSDVVMENNLENLGLVDGGILKDIQSKDIRIKQRGLEELLQALRDPLILQSVEDRLTFLLNILFSSQQQQLLQSISEQILTHLFANLREQVLVTKLHQIGLNLSKMRSPVGVRLALILLKRISPKEFIGHVLSDSILGAKSSKVREGALQILMTVSRIFPSTDMDVPKCVRSVVGVLKDRKRKVRQAALEALAALAQLSSTSIVLEVVTKIIEDYPDKDQILRLIRTRLSRRQLPVVDVGGNVRYSTPSGETEIEWLARGSGTPPSANFRKRQEEASENDANDETRRRYGGAAGDQKTNYWNTNALHADRTTEENESDWSRDSLQDETPNKNPTQIWAIDPTVFATTNKLTPVNGTLRPVFVVHSNGSQSPSNSRGFQNFPNTTNKQTNTGYYHVRNQRGRSFSPPKRNSENERFVQTENTGRLSNCKEERFRKSFSSDQLLSQDNSRQTNSMSSGSSASTSGSSLRSGLWNKDFRSAIPIPIHSDHRIRFRTRNVEQRKGPISANSAFYLPKTPTSYTTPEKFESPPRPIMVRQPFSSGSESSGYFTPPAEPHLQENFDHFAEQPRQNSASQSNRFVQIDTPVHHQNNFAVVNNYDRPDAETDKTSDRDEVDEPKEDFFHSKLIEAVTVKRDLNTNSLEDLDFIANLAFGERRLLSKSVAEITTNPEIVRKTVNSAPPLNEVTFAAFQRNEETPSSSTKTSLPGSVVDFQEIEIVQEVIETNPTKTTTKKIITRQMSRKRSCRTAKNETEVFSSSLRPFNKPKEALLETLNQLENGEWEVTMKGLQGLVRLIRHHQNIIEANLHAVCVSLGKHIRNLRSQVARAACLAASEMFITCKKTLEVELEELAAPLLHRTADTNKFLRSDANAALDQMCTHMSAPKVVAVITCKGARHQNAIVRCTAARLLCTLTHRLGPEKIFQLPKDTRDRILSTGANMLLEGSLETRKHAKMMLGNLSSHSQYQRAMLEAVPSSVMRHISKTLKTLI